LTTAFDDLLAAGRTRRRLPEPAVRRFLRERAGLSQAAVATYLEVTRPAVTLWEAGKRTPRGPKLAAYNDLLDRLARE
jgi:DNA-binding transcriptional regulator YiaG